LAIIFVVVLFFLKNKTTFENGSKLAQNGGENSLIYGDVTIENLVNKDTDDDGILDWEEGLWGTDPNKKETTPGVPDSVAISKLSAQGGSASVEKQELGDVKLTQTDKFSRELFATIAATSQNGTLDQATIDALGNSLSEQIQNSVPRKIYSIFDIKIINDNSVSAFRNYNNALTSLYKKYPGVNYTILDVLQKFMVDENSVDTSVLLKLDPIISQTNKIIEGMMKMSVPQAISTLHLNVINSLERLAENISDIKLYDTDAIMALGGISRYQASADQLETDLNNLANAINQKLSN